MNTTWRYYQIGGTITGILMCVFILFILSGCAAMLQPKLDEGQLRAIAADKNAGIVCATVTGMYGTVKYATMNLDKSVIPNGSVTLDGEKCSATITTEQARKP